MLRGAAVTLIGSIGLLRLGNFYDRVHAPTLGTTLGMAGILLGSTLYFTVLEARPVVHEILIAVFVTLTTPVTLMLLAGRRSIATVRRAARRFPHPKWWKT